MIWLSFGRWNHSAGRWFFRERIYWKGYRWTPFVRVSLRRSKPQPRWEIRVPDGTASTASILYEGRKLHGVRSVRLHIEAGGMAKLELELIPLRLELYGDELPEVMLCQN